MRALNKIFVGSLIFLVLATACAVFLTSVEKPFTLDETDIAIRAHYINIKGATTFLDGTQYLAHPPLYEYVVSWIFRTFGETEMPVRVFGILCYLLTGILLALLLKDVLAKYPSWIGKMCLGTGLLLYCVNPLLLQHSMLVDGDTTGTSLFGMLWLYLFVRCERLVGGMFVLSRLLIALAVAAMIWSKEITPFLVLGGLTAYRWTNRQWWRWILDVTLGFMLGAAIAWGIWCVYAAMTNIDVMVWLEYTLFKKTPRVTGVDYLSRMIDILPQILRWPVYWSAFPFFVLSLMVIAERSLGFLRKRRWEAEDALWITGLAVFIPYLFVKPSLDMMKYQFVVYPWLIAVIMTMAARVMQEHEDGIRDTFKYYPWMFWSVIPAIGALSVYYFGIGDYLIWIWDNSASERWKQFINLYYRPVAIGFLAVLVVCIWKKISFKMLFCFFCLAMVFPISMALSWNQTAPYTTAESWMNYGEKGHRETAEYLIANADVTKRIVMRNDIAYYVIDRAGKRFTEIMYLKQLLTVRDAAFLDKFFGAGAMEFIVMDNLSMVGLRPELTRVAFQKINEYFYLDKTFGNFKIYRLKQK